MSAVTTSSSLFLEFDQVTLRLYNKMVFPNTNWVIQEGEHWAILGANGSGKTVLAESLTGKYPVVSGTIRHYFFDHWKMQYPDQRLSGFGQLISVVSFSTNRLLHPHPDMYYQQRFHATETQGMKQVNEWLLENLADMSTQEGLAHIRESAGLLEIGYLLDRSVIQLSSGETRKLLILRALLKRPRLLILDEPFSGLDPQSRRTVTLLINRVAESGVTVILVAEASELPDCITHVIETDQLRIKGKYKKQDYKPSVRGPFSFQAENGLLSKIELDYKDYPFEETVRMKGVNVVYGGVQILKEVDWIVKKGERWAVSGPNGSGKSTLLSLINADNPQAYANEIWLFDRRKGSGESIWDIKKKIGYISPELHAYIPGGLLGREIILSGLMDQSGIPTRTQDWPAVALNYCRLLGIEALQDRIFETLSTGEQRLVLLAGALVKGPPLLILDEPCQGLDDYHREKIKWILEQVATHTSVTLIYVTHYAGEIPACVDKMLRLSGGREVPSEGSEHRIKDYS